MSEAPDVVYNSFLPAINAMLNSLAAVFLLLGYYFIKQNQRTAHRNCMIIAFGISSAFLVSYLYYHFNFSAQRFNGASWVRAIYLCILVSHIIGAIALVPGVIGTLYAAAKRNWLRHVRLTRWVWPLWMYTSVTGVVVYLFLYGDN